MSHQLTFPTWLLVNPFSRILLVFSRDGVETAENIVNINNSFVFNENANIKVVN